MVRSSVSRSPGRFPRLRRLTAAAVLAPVAVLIPAGTATAQAGPGIGWQADLSTVDGDDVNVRFDGALRLTEPRTGPAGDHGDLSDLGDLGDHGAGHEGQLLLPERALDRPVDRIRAEVDAVTPAGSAVHVSVRGRLDERTWTEWQPAPAVLPRPVRAVQVRIELRSGNPAGASPVVSAVRLTGENSGSTAAPRAAVAEPLTYRVFATREGLVGGQTANGHIITARDHFVSFPSGKSLSPKGTGDYTVRVCREDRSRCEYAPVWEKGPWNIRDDYWNPSAQRQMWQDLPQGKPEAQAAYQDGYNGGRDDKNRKVANPAGIDLADGTYWDGLKLTGNAWVDITYLWTGAGPTAVVGTEGGPLNVRADASTSAAIKGFAANYAKVTIECQIEGQTVTGRYGTSNIWHRIGQDHYVSDTYLQSGTGRPVAPKC
ncbi:hypothetical protein [Amycolatopsis nigrescens]|uniref:hypothetical protein n=1 Tax=Amycolatopsis nigrescens TaxID=381445 RepID=UPI00037D4E2D|nr:hypothetical protein [Amycolatopsis nigrescens]